MDYESIREEYNLSKQVNMEKWVKCKNHFEKNYPDKVVKIEEIKEYNKLNGYQSTESCLNKIGFIVLYPCIYCGRYFKLSKKDKNYTPFKKGYMELKCHNKWLSEYNNKIQSERMVKQQDKEKKEKLKRAKRTSYGIYGIYIENELVYIGKTVRNFNDRWKEHEACVKDRNIINSNQPYLYEAMRNNKYEFRKLIEFTSEVMYDWDLQCMEFALIETHKPKYNYVGVKVPYEFKR